MWSTCKDVNFLLHFHFTYIIPTGYSRSKHRPLTWVQKKRYPVSWSAVSVASCIGQANPPWPLHKGEQLTARWKCSHFLCLFQKSSPWWSIQVLVLWVARLWHSSTTGPTQPQNFHCNHSQSSCPSQFSITRGSTALCIATWQGFCILTGCVILLTFWWTQIR